MNPISIQHFQFSFSFILIARHKNTKYGRFLSIHSVSKWQKIENIRPFYCRIYGDEIRYYYFEYFHKFVPYFMAAASESFELFVREIKLRY